ARSAHSFVCSSRRRHTRFSRDWSSDVCSSDLAELNLAGFHFLHGLSYVEGNGSRLWVGHQPLGAENLAKTSDGFHHVRRGDQSEIGRASCREIANVEVIAMMLNLQRVNWIVAT